MSSAIPSSDLLSAIVSAQATLSSVERQFAENEAQIAEMQEQLNKAQEKRGILTADLKSAKELVTRVSGELAAFYQPSVDAGYASPAELPASPQPPATPFKKRYTKEEKKAMSPEMKRAFNRAKKALAEERKAMRTPEEQAKIDERVAKMVANRRSPKAQTSVDGSDAEGAIATA
jgi:peptidoglycan hydrolase CwlO-like protein